MRKSVFLLYVDLSKVHHHWDPKPIAQGGAGGVGSPSTAFPQVIHSLSTDCPHIHNLRTGYPQRRPARRRLSRAVGGSAVRCAAHGPQGARRGRVERDRARGRARQGGGRTAAPQGLLGGRVWCAHGKAPAGGAGAGVLALGQAVRRSPCGG